MDYENFSRRYTNMARTSQFLASYLFVCVMCSGKSCLDYTKMLHRTGCLGHTNCTIQSEKLVHWLLRWANFLFELRLRKRTKFLIYGLHVVVRLFTGDHDSIHYGQSKKTDSFL